MIVSARTAVASTALVLLGVSLSACASGSGSTASSPTPTISDYPDDLDGQRITEDGLYVYTSTTAIADAFVAAGGPCNPLTEDADGPGLDNADCGGPVATTHIAWFERPVDAETWAETDGIDIHTASGAAVVLGGNWVIVTAPDYADAAVSAGGLLLQEQPLG